MPGKKPTREQLAERVDLTVELLRSMYPKWYVKDALQEQYAISREAAEDYVARARAKLAEEDAIPRMDKRSKVSAHLEKVLADDGTLTRDRIRAIREYCKIHGLYEHRPIDEDVNAEAPELVVPDWRAAFRDRLARGEIPSAGGNGNGGGENGGGGNGGGGNGAKPSKKGKA